MTAATLLLTLDEAAEQLRISEDSLRVLISQGAIQTVDVGTGSRPRTRIARGALEDFISGRETNRPNRVGGAA